jgi:hypothetical protein
MLALFFTPAGYADLISEVQMDHQRVTVECRILASGGEVILSKKSANAKVALQQWLSKFQESAAQNDVSALATLLNTPPAAVDHLKQIGASISAQFQREEILVIHFSAKDQASRNAIHQFLRSTCAKISAEPGADHPGNNLGWDAPRGPDTEK